MAGGRYPARKRQPTAKAQDDDGTVSDETEHVAGDEFETVAADSQDTIPAVEEGEEVDDEDGRDDDAMSEEETVDLEDLDVDEADEDEVDMEDRFGSRGRSNRRLTARQRAKLDGTSEATDHLLSLPPVPAKRSRLTTEEQQLRRAEAAKRRKLLSDKKRKEEQHQTIQKILGGVSASKRRETEAAQKMEEKESQRAMGGELGPDTIRVHMDGERTHVTWSEDLDLPTALHQGSCTYPVEKQDYVLEGMSDDVSLRLGLVLHPSLRGKKELSWKTSEGRVVCTMPPGSHPREPCVVRTIHRHPTTNAISKVWIRPL
uniref:INO80 complex subunit B-like conserved region domain-containing protein n=1 Tax=Picocystis salinarum TaxID=88271 RepID=A0A7S3UDZ5_9CHLO|mmetsp:Transcript_8203/g.50989  ORF Transcript_8203/g.50989 Transcript_8203/m.50989 type:complete len:316 (+) Transcript_8203:449-1396(+)